MAEAELAHLVNDALLQDPRTGSPGIAVSATGGAVVLRGTVGSFHQKRAAAKAAARVPGVVSVSNRIDVEILTDERREDADLRGDVLEALMLDSQVPMSVDANVEDAWVTLTGDVDWPYQREEAERVAGNVMGVREVLNHIRVGSASDIADDVAGTIRTAFLRDARVDAERLMVDVSNGIITLTGRVHSAQERAAAVAAAWSAPGVRAVDDRLDVRA